MFTLSLPRAVIFDMDGTLLDSERVALDCFAQAAQAIGAPWREEVGLSLVGLNARDSDRRILAAFGEDFPIAALRHAFDERYEDAIVRGAIPLKPYVRELFDYLDARRIPCAVATSTRRTRAETKLARAGLLPRFRALACGDEVRHGKPAPDIFELAARHLGVEPRHCLALEDSNAGVRSAVSASMPVVMLLDLLRPDADICRLGVACADSLKDVLLALQRA
ncbi:MAG: hypothetical protein CGU28_09005 [Candidatus Dactylopiibacterium carminicum]|nr:HAD family phosphatase [Candidatus Dactylopiibacterium carminicum]PAS94400.1 MAG: hypothetical protein CGU29_03555 [Candidatus Dactylopiibacterium carminicum]PAS96437.1 MAG: hypothetical protein CGU28_09005 [Candidatus Dactylopiibacterium carminicum]PAS99561.1 MAG: hypothetical protein BSR46_07285 [Candidatus Dactylopiibacterium carminicum]